MPEGGSPRRRPGLTIHRRAADGYRAVGASVALPGWTAAEIHAALNEAALSEATCAVLERVGGALGEAAGTGPDDDPWLGAQRREARAEGRAEDRADGCAEIVRSILRNRGLDVSERLAARIAGEDPDVLAAEALACRDEADLLARLEARRRAGRPHPVAPAAEVPGTVGEVRDLALVRVETDEQRRVWNTLMAHEHPRGAGPFVGPQLRYLVGSGHGCFRAWTGRGRG